MPCKHFLIEAVSLPDSGLDSHRGLRLVAARTRDAEARDPERHLVVAREGEARVVAAALHRLLAARRRLDAAKVERLLDAETVALRGGRSERGD